MQEIDEVTLKAAVKGDRLAFKRIYNFYIPFVWKIAFNMSGRNFESAKEIVQETFLKVFESVKKFKGNSAFSTWLYRVTYTTAINYLRKNKNNNFNINPDFLISSEKSDHYEVQQITNQILSTLSPEERFLLVAREIEEIPFEEISKIMGISSGALRTRLHRLKQQIRTSEFFTNKRKE